MDAQLPPVRQRLLHGHGPSHRLSGHGRAAAVPRHVGVSVPRRGALPGRRRAPGVPRDMEHAPIGGTLSGAAAGGGGVERPGATVAVQAERLSKVYVKRRSLREIGAHPFRRAERITALSDLTLETRAGEIFGILGPNGAGKTTFLKILAGLILPTSGRAFVSDIDVARHVQAVKRSIGFV